VHCNRPLIKAAVSIPSKNGILAWGPKCAKLLRMAAPDPKRARRVTPQRDNATRDLFEGDAA